LSGILVIDSIPLKDFLADTFNLDPVRIAAKYPGKRHFKGKNIGKPSGNP
jgi:hypothetical protein